MGMLACMLIMLASGITVNEACDYLRASSSMEDCVTKPRCSAFSVADCPDSAFLVARFPSSCIVTTNKTNCDKMTRAYWRTVNCRVVIPL